jgi:hypothetical protein
MRTSLCVILVGFLSLANDARAGDAPLNPKILVLRQDEDWSALRDLGLRSNIFDRLKFVPFNSNGSSWLTLGGEARERYEYIENANWGQGPQDGDGYFLHRFMVHADTHTGENFRFFTQFKTGLESDRNSGPRPADRDDFDVHQLFADLRVACADQRSLSLRAGRQELAFGTQRLVSVREGPNARQSFDGVRATWRWDDFQLDAFATRPAETKPGVFDDGPDPHTKFWGLCAVTPIPVLPGGKADFYYLGVERDAAQFDQGTAREMRHSVGTRLWGQHAGWDWNFEFVYQFGEFGDGHISAWTAASDTGFTFAEAPWSPRLGLKADVTTGDRNANDRDLQTFNPLFPKGAYFGETGLIGPVNHIDLHPSLELHPNRSLTLTVDSAFFWRESTQDGVYNIGQGVARSGVAGRARYVGAQTSAHIEWRVHKNLTWTANYSHFFAGAFLHENPPGKDVSYFSTWITFRF